ncbi:cysteine-rich CWC family protein [Accumulibacter sp.]|uniref:cysteine-rich CWC family protein n=1 Tax=Accumulibacter sp. TaxID=2053492 RepID=UPI0025FABC22|nr:cysteine-rich CWC family protein [Accumulibacter sp.]
MPDASQKALDSVCDNCGASFVCGAAAGLASCWCMEKPPTGVAPEPGGRCYCPTCLAQRLSLPVDPTSRGA